MKSVFTTKSFILASTFYIQELVSYVSDHSLSIATYSLLLNLLIYFLMNGAQIFETLIFVPRWANGNLKNLQLLNIESKSANLKTFWILFHSIHEVIFLVSVLFCYRMEGIGRFLVILFLIHFLVRVWTVVYFAQKIIRFQTLAETNDSHFSDNVRSEIKKWVFLNYFRVGIYLGISICMLPLVIKILKMNG